MQEYLEKIEDILESITKEEELKIKQAAKIMFDAMQDEKVVHVFATGHSHMFAEEMFYRAGGLVQIDPILIPDLMQHVAAITSTKLEREEGRALEIYKSLDLKEKEPFSIVSNSGINAVPVEMAIVAKENKHPVIVITSLASSTKLNTRNKYNKHLYEVADLVIDNHVPYGDGVIVKPYGNIASSSSIAGNFIAQALVLEVIKLYEEKGITPPIYISANLPGGDAHNQKLIGKYSPRIKALK